MKVVDCAFATGANANTSPSHNGWFGLGGATFSGVCSTRLLRDVSCGIAPVVRYPRRGEDSSLRTFCRRSNDKTVEQGVKIGRGQIQGTVDLGSLPAGEDFVSVVSVREIWCVAPLLFFIHCQSPQRENEETQRFDA